jgi:hypothetical protein
MYFTDPSSFCCMSLEQKPNRVTWLGGPWRSYTTLPHDFQREMRGVLFWILWLRLWGVIRPTGWCSQPCAQYRTQRRVNGLLHGGIWDRCQRLVACPNNDPDTTFDITNQRNLMVRIESLQSP